MALSAFGQNAGPLPVRPITGRARQRAFAAARRHSRLVRLLRVLLPVGGAAVIAVFVLVAKLGLPGPIDLSAARLSVTRNSVIMEEPRITGFDRAQQEYSVSADRAIQPLTRPDQVRLERIEAKLLTTGQGATTITAEAGEYDHSDRTLRLRGSILVDSAAGYSLSMTDADIDFGAGTFATANPTTARYQDSEISAQRLSVSEGGDRIVFEGAVRTVLMPPKREPAANAPAGE
jgi:lipopolysaccharide export system protein LptC